MSDLRSQDDLLSQEVKEKRFLEIINLISSNTYDSFPSLGRITKGLSEAGIDSEKFALRFFKLLMQRLKNVENPENIKNELRKTIELIDTLLELGNDVFNTRHYTWDYIVKYRNLINLSLEKDPVDVLMEINRSQDIVTLPESSVLSRFNYLCSTLDIIRLSGDGFWDILHLNATDLTLEAISKILDPHLQGASGETIESFMAQKLYSTVDSVEYFRDNFEDIMNALGFSRIKINEIFARIIFMRLSLNRLTTFKSRDIQTILNENPNYRIASMAGKIRLIEVFLESHKSI